MTDSKFEVDELWHNEYREGDGPWLKHTPEIADFAAVLRTYDYGQEHNPEKENRIVRTEVRRTVEDPEHLRELVEKKTAEKDTEVLPFE